MASDDSPALDPLSPAFAWDPYPAYARLRARPEPVYDPLTDTFLVARFADVAAIARDPTMVRAPEAVMSPEEVAERRRRENWHDMPFHARFVQFSLLDSDGPVHDRLRRLVLGWFTPSLMGLQRPAIEAVVDTLVDGFAGGGEIEFIEDVAARVPGRVIGRVLGVPDADGPRLRRWSEDIVQFFDVDRSDARKALAEATTREFHDYLVAALDERRARPRGDVLSRLAAAEAAGRASRDEAISTAMLILMAGHGSTIDVLGTALHALLRFPDEMRRLREDPALAPSAVQEMLRFESPLPFFHRYATRETEVGGRVFPRGTRFGLLYGAANRDPQAFPEPDRFDVGRAPNRHLAFGGGPHLCLGLHLARLELDVVFTTLLRRFREIAPTGPEPVYKTGLSVRGLRALPVALRPA
ncbi:cytochrome P450 [Salinarimonas soli]|uniref:Cytochrome P450 n=1 Tax=Salinarimonas soli TaxID=1638099 RepID=A0A5B2VGH3_9HYPH|nr:cytochrome P450 [Salinarimonas soli]KAA2238015.1 cytochrome P450 [Salinarimonas soli]